MLKNTLEIIFPNKCGFCDAINKECTCKKCKIKLEYICTNDKMKKIDNKFFDYYISSYYYEDIVRKIILDFKFKNKKYLYKSLSEKLIQNLIKANIGWIDYIVYVPISFKRFLERGYNQSYLIAKHISKKTNKPILKYVLKKTKNNKKQSSLKINERFENVQNVYRVMRKDIIKGKNILLLDDIYTTGATVNECSKVLKEAGAGQILVATVARGK